MGNTSKFSPFAAAAGISASGDDYLMAGLHRLDSYALRHWRGRHSVPRAPVDASKDADPYLLVLLADQEFEADRTDQAESLIEAAYAAYDQCRFGS